MKYRIRLTQIATIFLLIIAKPYSWKLFVLGLALALTGELIRLWSSGYLKKDKTLAATGPYRVVRNPLYVGSFLMSLGFATVCINFSYPYRTAALFLVILLGFKFVYSLQVKAEEKHLEKLFGEDYRQYKTRVNKYFPALKHLPKALKEGNFSFAQVKKNKELTTVYGFIVVAGILASKIYFGI